MIWIQSDIHHTLHFLIQLTHTHTHSQKKGGFSKIIICRWWWQDEIYRVVLLILFRKAQVCWGTVIGIPTDELSANIPLANAIFSFEEEGQHTHMMVASCSDCHHAATPILASNVDWLDHWCCVFVKLLNIWNLDVLICFCRSIFGLNLV